MGFFSKLFKAIPVVAIIRSVKRMFKPKMPALPEPAAAPAAARRESGAEVRIGDSADNIRNARVSGGGTSNPLGSTRGRSGLNI